MKKIGQVDLVLIYVCSITIALMSYLGNISTTLGKDIESYHKETLTPSRSLMRIISSHTAKILDAILIGDHDAVIKESNAVAEDSKAILKNFFPEGGQIGEWFKETGKDPRNPDDVNAVKKDFEKYMKTVIDASKNIAETSKKQNIVETYKSFDEMLKKACFTCHEAFRPEWPKWMQITGG